MKNFFRDLNGSFGSPTKGFWVFVAIVLIGMVLLGGMMCKRKKDPPAPQRSALELSLMAENKRLQDALFETQTKLATALGKMEVLKDSITALRENIRIPVSPPKAETRARTGAKTTSRATRDKSIRSVRTTVVCNCPTAFGYYRNRGTRTVLTKKYCKIHGTRKY